MIQRDRLVQTFTSLAQIDSPSGEEESMAQEVSRRLEAAGLTVQRDSYGNVIARGNSSGPARVLLSAHMDTVQPCIGIKPRVEGDRIVSDGSTIIGGDCKAGIASILEALESLRDDGKTDLPVEVAFSRQEEVGLVGAKNLDFSLLTAKQAVVFDTSGPVSHVVSASPTYIAFEIEIAGRAAHAGVEPEKGLSAIKVAADIVTHLPQGRIDPETTVNVGLVKGGSGRNSVPAQTHLTGEFRSRNPQTLERVWQQVEESVALARRHYPSAGVDLKFEKDFDGYNLAENEAWLGTVLKTLRDLKMEPDLAPSGGGTDGNVMRQHGISALVVGMGAHGIHTVNETVEIPWLLDAVKVCQALILGQG